MSGQLRALRNRIKSVENTKKITRAMEMVAAAKLRRFQDMMQRSRPFTEGLEKLLARVNRPAFANLHPFIEKREEKSTEGGSPPKDGSVRLLADASGGKVALVLITSDTGLCGSYNNDLVNLGLRFVRGQKERPVVLGVGKSGILALKNAGFNCKAAFTDLRASRVEEILVELRRELEAVYLSKEVDAVYVVYSHFKTLTAYKAVSEKILPLEDAAGHFDESEGRGEISASKKRDFSATPRNDIPTEDYIFEPSPEDVFKKLIPFFFEAKVRTVFLEAIVSEQIARMTAMNMATKNAKEMIDSLVLKRNKARQASITKELIEIVSGSQALKLK